MMDGELARLREKYLEAGSTVFEPYFRQIAARNFDADGSRLAPYSGIPTLLDAPHLPIGEDWARLASLQVGLIGIPMDLGVTNRNGSRFGPRALRNVERIGPYNHVLRCAPIGDLKVADIGDIPFRSRYNLEACHEDIERFLAKVVDGGVIPLSVGGDHSISYAILRAIGRRRPVGMIHIDAHCDTSGPFDMTKFHHAGPFRNAVLDGVLDPRRTIQIGIRGAAEYLWEFSRDSGMTVIHAEEVDSIGIPAVIEQARAVVGDGPTYLSFDVDSIDPAIAPGTGTPEVGGLNSREVLQLIRGFAGINLIGGDVVEVAPQYDPTTNTAQLAAQVLFEVLSLMTFSPALRAGAGT